MIRVALVVGSMVAIGCGSSKPALTSGAAAGTGPSQPAVDCTTSDDCELVQACCGCNEGGKQIAIRKDAMSAFNGSREQRCGGSMCPQMISTDPSCSAEAVCGQSGRCEVAAHMGHQQDPSAPP